MEDAALARLSRLEARVDALELRLRSAAPVAAAAAATALPAVPPPLPPATPAGAPADVPTIADPAPPTAPPAAPDGAGTRPTGARHRALRGLDAAPTPPPARRFDPESFLGLAVLGRVGVFAVLLAAAWFAQRGWSAMGPMARVLVIHFGAAAMVGVGFAVEGRVQRRYAALLFAGGTALGYVGGIAAGLVYELVPPEVAMALLALQVALSQVLARRVALPLMAGIALLGGYLAPWLTGADPRSPTPVIAWLLLLHGWAAFVDRRWGWVSCRRIAVVATALSAVTVLGRFHGLGTWSMLLYAHAVLFGLLAPELRAALAGFGEPLPRRWPWVLAAAHAGAAGALLLVLYRGEPRGFALLLGATWLSLGAALVAAAPRGVTETLARARALSRLGGVLLVLGAMVLWSPSVRIDPMFELLELTTGGGTLGATAWQRLGATAAAGLLLLATRRWTAVDDVPVVLAAALGLLLSMSQGDDALGHTLAMAALIVPLALATHGAHLRGRFAGVVLGSAVAAVSVRLIDTLAAPVAFWLPIAAVASVWWLGALVWWHERRGDDAFAARVAGLLTAALAATAPLALGLARPLATGLQDLDAVPTPAMPVAGALAMIAAAALRRTRAANGHAPGIAELGGLLLLVGGLAAATPWADPSGPTLPPLTFAGASPLVPMLWLVAAAPLLLLPGRRWTGGGQVAGAIAALFAAATALLDPTASAARWPGLMAALPAATVVLAAPGAWARALGLVLGAVALYGGIGNWDTFATDDGGYVSLAFGAAGGFAAGGALLASWRADRVLLRAACGVLLALGVGWSVLALGPDGTAAGGGMAPFANLRFLTAAVLVALLELGRRRLPTTAEPLERAVFAAIVLALPYLAGLIELLLLVRTWSSGWSDAVVSLYSGAFALGLLVAGFARREAKLRWPGLVGLVVVVGKVLLYDLAALGVELRMLVTFVVGLLLLVAAFAYARRRDPAT